MASIKSVGYDLLVTEMLEGVTLLFNNMLSLDGSISSDRLIDLADTIHVVFDNQQKFHQNFFQHELYQDANKMTAQTNFTKFTLEEIRWR